MQIPPRFCGPAEPALALFAPAIFPEQPGQLGSPIALSRGSGARIKLEEGHRRCNYNASEKRLTARVRG